MKIYVGNLQFGIDDNALKELFAPYGEVTEATVIKDKFSNRSKGFGFVTIEDEEASKKAISEMNEKEIEGRKLTVNEARPREERPQREFNRGSRDSGRSPGRDSRGPRRY